MNDEEELSEFLAEANVWRGTTEEDSNSSAVLSDIADTAAQSETRVALTPMTNTAECQNEIFINDKQALKAVTLARKLSEDCSKARELQSKDVEEEEGLSRGFPVLSRHVQRQNHLNYSRSAGNIRLLQRGNGCGGGSVSAGYHFLSCAIGEGLHVHI